MKTRIFLIIVLMLFTATGIKAQQATQVASNNADAKLIMQLLDQLDRRVNKLETDNVGQGPVQQTKDPRIDSISTKITNLMQRIEKIDSTENEIRTLTERINTLEKKLSDKTITPELSEEIRGIITELRSDLKKVTVSKPADTSSIKKADEKKDHYKGVKDLKFEAVYYLSYMNTDIGTDDNANKFAVKRGYMTAKKEIFPFLSSRITLDAHQDDTGDMKVRLKYIYAHFKLKSFGVIYKPNIEFGLVHTPWLDFEEHINYYRMQGTMYMERVGIFNSADFGVSFLGYFGGEMDEDYQKHVNKKYAGKYGSFSFGVYNGGGYHANEVNKNKVLQGRLTIRPFPEYVPGLQVSYLGIFGKGNKDEVDHAAPDYKTNALMLSHENKFSTLTGTLIRGEGNKKGKWYDSHHSALEVSGYSIFGELKPKTAKSDFWKNVRLIGRYDYFDPNKDVENDTYKRIIVGAGYDFGHQNILIVDYDVVNYDNSALENTGAFKMTMQIHY